MYMDSLKATFVKKDIQKKFNISLATVNNWIKTGVIPAPENGYYTKDVYSTIVHSIETNSDRLHSRANRSFSHKSDSIFLGITNVKRKDLLIKLVLTFKASNLSVLQAVVCLAKQILISNNLYETKSEIYTKLQRLYADDAGDNLFKDFVIENEDDDILGAFYQSVQSISTKSKSGSFYTPPELLSSIKIPESAKVLDPCCGSGSILINTLSKNHNPNNIYAFDIDEIALLICHVNLILFFNNAFITPHIEKSDLIFCNANTSSKITSSKTVLYSNTNETFDFIVTNPPWGSKLSKEQKDILLKQYPDLSTTEVCSIALYNAIQKLSKRGTLYFFLPESLLNVSTHKNIRKFLLSLRRNIEITPLGMAFKGVQSECVLLKLSEITNKETEIIIKKETSYALNKKNISAPDYFISYTVDKTDDLILRKIYSAHCVKLSTNTKFALGIVTGNNKKYIHEIKGINEEAIFRGKDILPYKLKEPETFINFTPDVFQQVAPIEMYRAKKIVYKFISDKIVCALDSYHLVLNSANIIISNDYPMEILVCLFNSPIYTFMYQKKFKSKKVLKQHFQDFPLPVLDKKLKEKFLSLYSSILNGIKKQEDVDVELCAYFKITEDEYIHIKECVWKSLKRNR